MLCLWLYFLVLKLRTMFACASILGVLASPKLSTCFSCSSPILLAILHNTHILILAALRKGLCPPRGCSALFPISYETLMSLIRARFQAGIFLESSCLALQPGISNPSLAHQETNLSLRMPLLLQRPQVQNGIVEESKYMQWKKTQDRTE